jgi:hypothetical protein
LQQPHERVVAAGIVPTGNKDASLILAAGGLGAFLILRGRGSKLVKEMLKTAPTTDAAKFATEAEAKLMEQATAKFGEADSAAKRAFLSKQRQHIRSAESDILDVMKRFFDGSTTDDENEFIRAAVIREKTELRDKAWAEYTKDWTPEQKAKWATVEERASSTFTTNIRSEDVTFEPFQQERGMKRRHWGLAKETLSVEDQARYKAPDVIDNMLKDDNVEARANRVYEDILSGNDKPAKMTEAEQREFDTQVRDTLVRKVKEWSKKYSEIPLRDRKKITEKWLKAGQMDLEERRAELLKQPPPWSKKRSKDDQAALDDIQQEQDDKDAAFWDKYDRRDR